MERARNISKSMIAYLKRARDYQEFIKKETTEFERGKRHLANMMGLDSETMTQKDIDDAIRYLFPSGLFEPKARPIMKHPDLIYKAQKGAQFDIEGRPNHYLFYTTKPNYYDCLNSLTTLIKELNEYEDKQVISGVFDSPDSAKYMPSGKTWLSHKEMCEMFLEEIDEADYNYLISSLTHLLKHPYSIRAQEFIDQYSKDLSSQTVNIELPTLQKDESTGLIYTDIESKNREHRVQVKTVLNGTGKIDIEGQDILYFESAYHRRAILFPLQMSGMIDKVDILARISVCPRVKGPSAVATAIRNAVARSIAAYTSAETRTRMRLAGLLTFDPRTKERKKYGQEGARRKFTWKKR